MTVLMIKIDYLSSKIHKYTAVDPSVNCTDQVAECQRVLSSYLFNSS